MHRNTFINSPTLLDEKLSLKTRTNIKFAGQITGVEGYVESAAMGLLAGRFAAAELMNFSVNLPPSETALGALLAHVTGGAEDDTFQPMNINFGLFPSLKDTGKRKLPKKDKYRLYAERALNALTDWQSS